MTSPGTRPASQRLVTEETVDDHITRVGNATYGRPVPNTLGVIGDSITDFGSAPVTATYNGWNVKGYWVWAQVLLRKRLLLLKDFGVAGDSTAQILARVPNYVAGGAPGWNFVLGGTNDAAGLVPLATTTGNLTAIWDAIEAAGGRVVALTVPPRTGASAAVNARINEINNWIKRQSALRKNLIVVDIYPRLVAASSGDFATGNSSDGVHPSPKGARIMGKAVADTLDPLIPRIDPLPASAVDGKNLITNPFMTGTSGTVGAGGTGQVATGYQVNPLDGVASVFECSKVARTDGIAGEWQQVKVVSGQVKLNWNYTGFGTNYVAGDRVYAICEFQADADFANAAAQPSDFFQLKMAATKPDFGDGNAGVDFGNNADTVFVGGADMISSGVFMTPVITVPDTATHRLALELQRKGAGTFRAGRCAIYREGTGPAY